MKQGDAIELLNKLSDRDAIIFIYRFVLGLSVTKTAECRGYSRQTYYNHIETITKVCAELEHHQEAISAIQELFKDSALDGFFVEKECKTEGV